MMSPGIDRGTQRGSSLAELAILLPVILAVLLGVIDFGRLVYAHQALGDLSREAANLVSRGATVEASFAAAAAGDGPVRVSEHGAMIISTIRRRSLDDPTPWIFDQYAGGPRTWLESRVGVSGGAARVPYLDELDVGVTVFAVELFHDFAPLFPAAALGLNFYPETVYEAAFF